jgi:hypothetical protein
MSNLPDKYTFSGQILSQTRVLDDARVRHGVQKRKTGPVAMRPLEFKISFTFLLVDL